MSHIFPPRVGKQFWVGLTMSTKMAKVKLNNLSENGGRAYFSKGAKTFHTDLSCTPPQFWVSISKILASNLLRILVVCVCVCVQD